MNSRHVQTSQETCARHGYFPNEIISVSSQWLCVYLIRPKIFRCKTQRVEMFYDEKIYVPK